jgi:hypothetical protein
MAGFSSVHGRGSAQWPGQTDLVQVGLLLCLYLLHVPSKDFASQALDVLI